jgi:hypothetical protein
LIEKKGNSNENPKLKNIEETCFECTFERTSHIKTPLFTHTYPPSYIIYRISNMVNYQTRSKYGAYDLFIPSGERLYHSRGSDHETLKMAKLFLNRSSKGPQEAPKKVHFATLKSVRTTYRKDTPYVGWFWPAYEDDETEEPEPCEESIGFVLSNHYEDSMEEFSDEPHEVTPWYIPSNFKSKISNNKFIDVEWSATVS